MPLSKQANRDRMKQAMRVKRLAEFRLQQANSSPYRWNVVQPIPDYLFIGPQPTTQPDLDADGNVIPVEDSIPSVWDDSVSLIPKEG